MSGANWSSSADSPPCELSPEVAARQQGLRTGFTTDNGNLILDVYGLTILKPLELEAEINNITGVVTNGLFAQRGADVLLLGTAVGVKTIKRK